MMSVDNLEELRNHKLQMPKGKADALQDLYNFRAKKFQELKKDLTTTSKGRISNICPYCQLDIVGTLDHILPKTAFPEYSSMPWNLIPCCSTCNSKKDDYWLDKNNKRCFINFYIDDIPPMQYFFADVSAVNGNIDIQFSLRFPAGYDTVLQTRIENHYEQLDLIKRYLENSDDVITELEFSVRNYAPRVPDAEIIRSINKTCSDMQALMGVNYWKAVLEKACANTPTVFNLLK